MNLKPHLDFKVVYGIHWQRLNNLKILEDSFSTREVVHHLVVLDDLILTRAGTERVN